VRGWMKVSLECSWDLIWKYFNTHTTQNNVYLFLPSLKRDWCELNKIWGVKLRAGECEKFSPRIYHSLFNWEWDFLFIFRLHHRCFTPVTRESQWIINIWNIRQQKAATSEKRVVSPKIMLHCSFFLLLHESARIIQQLLWNFAFHLNIIPH
jgi:hypothetical protein